MPLPRRPIRRASSGAFISAGASCVPSATASSSSWRRLTPSSMMFGPIQVSARTSSRAGARRPPRCRRRLPRSLVRRQRTRPPRPRRSNQPRPNGSGRLVTSLATSSSALRPVPIQRLRSPGTWTTWRGSLKESTRCRAGRQPEAERIFKGLVRRFPASYEVHQYLGRSLAARGAHDEAIRALEAAQRLSPQTALVEYDVAKSLAAKGQFDAALDHVNHGTGARTGDLLRISHKG